MIYLKACTNVTIAHNIALSTGGGICVETDFLESRPMCFFQLDIDSLINQSLLKLYLLTSMREIISLVGQLIFAKEFNLIVIKKDIPALMR